MAIRQFLALLGFLLLCTLLGYWVGSNPEFYEKSITLGQTEPTVYVENREFLNADLAATLSDISHVDFVLADDPDKADLWIISLDFLKKNASYNSYYHRLEQIQISPDFKLNVLEKFRALPVAWKVANRRIRLLAVVAPIRNKRKMKKSLIILIQSLFTKEFQLEMIRLSDWNTTLQALDENTIPDNRKSSAVRKMDLSRLGF
jgi:hypothetical protein